MYEIHAGAQFGVECSSVATPDNEFVGRVTWYRRGDSDSGLFINVYTKSRICQCNVLQDFTLYQFK